MGKLKSLADLKKIQQESRQRTELRAGSDSNEGLVQVRVAMATCGMAAGARAIMDFFSDELEKRGIGAVVSQTGCMSYCYAEPTIEVQLPGNEPVVYGFVDLKRADEIIEKYIKNGELVEGIIPVNYETID
ncbi:MAG: (2Fe-2S) ferredoxin domain-containing protein [Bacteroidales bacterium]|jgi:NADP-reducing hydrogenase subunit HndB|nr:(2Fe-2S) ferredoxin domain-containing protein [Bacteroidales bacterium]